MFCNIATYKFVTIDENELPTLCREIKNLGTNCSLKGTVLLGTEGINLFLAGQKNQINDFQNLLNDYPMFQDLPYKYSYSDFVPFHKLSVKVRNEIVTFRQQEIQPEKLTAPYITPQQLSTLLDNNSNCILLDTRNDYECKIGQFEKAVHLNIQNFREFPDAFNQMQIDKTLPIITCCTGGIRCEKASAYLLQQGFKEVYQLQGGILNYFEQCGGKHYEGDCFVFDDRIAVNSNLEALPHIENPKP